MNKYSFSLDSALFLGLVASYLWLGEVARLVPQNTQEDAFLIAGLWRIVMLPVVVAPVVLGVGAYIGAEFFMEERPAYTVKSIIIWLSILLFVIVPTAMAIALRGLTAPYHYVHDGQIQIEEAARFFLAGKNPYAENYLNTPMAQWPFYADKLAMNPALFHFAYLPFMFLAVVPFEAIARVAVGWFDLRFVLLPAFVATLLVLQRSVDDRQQKLALLMLVGLNPLFIPFFVEGRTDILVLCPLVISVFLLRSGHRLASIVALTLACAIKQTAWFIVPFYLVYYLCLERGGGWEVTFKDTAAKLRVALPQIIIASAIFALIVLPFVVWNSSKFIDDVFLYPAGFGELAYPINSLGFGGFALEVGWIPSYVASFPFERLQFVTGIPAMLALWRFQLTKNNAQRLWLSYGLFFLLIGFLSHVFNDNHLGFAISVLAIAVVSDTGR